MAQRSVEEMEIASAHARVENAAAFQVSLLLRREFGLSPCDAEAELRRDSLTVRLHQALTPIGRLIARTEGGGQVVQVAYQVLHESCRERLHARVARIVGLPVLRSRIEVDATAEDMFVRFDLSPSLSPEINGAGAGREMENA